MICTTLLLCLGAQDPAPAPVPPQDPTPAEAPAEQPVAKWSDRDARTAVRTFERALKDKDATMLDKLNAIAELAKGSNELLVKPLAKVVLAERSVEVRKQAAAAMGHQPPEQAAKTILVLIEQPPVADQPAVMASLIGALSKAGYTRALWPGIQGLFEKEYDLKRVPLQKALLELIRDHKETEAWGILLRNLDEPIPDDPDSPKNPPKEYWEARWKSWQAFRSDVKEAMHAITGQRFSTADEARAWVHKNGSKVGL